MTRHPSPPDALLLMGRHCPYCPTVLKGLEALEADGLIGELETIVIEDHPERAAELGVRSVPWVRIGPFELDGLRSEHELRDWAEKAGTMQGMASYMDELLSTGKIAQVLEMTEHEPGMVKVLLQLFTAPDTKLNTRIGISAVMESLEGSITLRETADKLHALLRHGEARVRADACHYLSLSGHPEAAGWIRPLQDDADESVREIAAECLSTLDDTSGQ